MFPTFRPVLHPPDPDISPPSSLASRSFGSSASSGPVAAPRSRSRTCVPLRSQTSGSGGPTRARFVTPHLIAPFVALWDAPQGLDEEQKKNSVSLRRRPTAARGRRVSGTLRSRPNVHANKCTAWPTSSLCCGSSCRRHHRPDPGAFSSSSVSVCRGLYMRARRCRKSTWGVELPAATWRYGKDGFGPSVTTP
jgi:hypothetical protein